MKKLIQKFQILVVSIIALLFLSSTAYAVTILSVPQGGSGVGNITGIIKGNGTAPFSVAVPGTDYVTGSSTAGNVTFWNGTGNITGDSFLSWDNALKTLSAYQLQIPSLVKPGGVAYIGAAGMVQETATGTVGQLLASGGSGAPTWTSPSSFVFSGGCSSGVTFYNSSNNLTSDCPSFTYTNTYGLHVGNTPGTRNSDVGGFGTEVSASNNTTGGVNMILSNTSAGSSAYTSLFFQNDLANSIGTHFGNIGMNSSTYNDTSFGALVAVPNQMGITNTDGPISVGTLANSFVNFFVGGSNLNNQVARITSVGIGANTSTPTALFHGIAKASRGPAAFTGIGLNNLTATGTYTGDTQLSNYKVTISAVNGVFASTITNAGTGYVVGDILTITTGGANSTSRVTGVNAVTGAITGLTGLTAGSGYTTGVKPVSGGTGTGATFNVTAVRDYFTWQKDATTVSTATAITAAAQLLAEGVSVTFATTTGHTTGDLWTIAVDSTDAFKADDALGNNIFRASNGSVYANRIYMTRAAAPGNGYLFNEPGTFPKTGLSTTGMWSTGGNVILGASAVAGVTVSAGVLSLSSVGSGGPAAVTLNATGTNVSALRLTAGTITVPSLFWGTGVAPTTPTNGDSWFDNVHLYTRINGVTKQLDNDTNPVVGSCMSGTPGVLTSTSTTISVTTAMCNILVNTTSNVSTVTMPTAIGISGQPFTIKDWKGTSLVNNITINTTGGQTIDGATSTTININYRAYTLLSDGANWSII